MVCYVAHRCYCQLVGGLEGSYVVSCWKYDVCFSQRPAVVAEVVEVGAFARVKIVWKLSQRVAVDAEAGEVGAKACVKIVWKLGQRPAAGAEVGEVSARTCVKIVWKLGQRVAVGAKVIEVGRCVSVASVIVNEVEALQYVIVSKQTI